MQGIQWNPENWSHYIWCEQDYVIGDTVPDEWQQRVDDVVAGMDITW